MKREKFDVNKIMKEYAANRHMSQTLKALEFINNKHVWEKPLHKGFYNIPPVPMAYNAFNNMGIDDDDTIAAILLQNVGAYGISLEELPVTKEIRHSVDLLTFRVSDGETQEVAKKRYYNALVENRIAILTKLVIMLHNFPKAETDLYVHQAKAYIEEVHQYILPAIEKAKTLYSSDAETLSRLQRNINSITDSMDLTVQVLQKNFGSKA